jgi:hypothetical protein
MYSGRHAVALTMLDNPWFSDWCTLEYVRLDSEGSTTTPQQRAITFCSKESSTRELQDDQMGSMISGFGLILV